MDQWPLAALTLMALAAGAPLLRDAYACTDDFSFHLFRAVELGRLIELGHPFPRWAPDMALGYGYPFFNFYAPLSSYGVVLIHYAGLAYPAALKLAFVLAIWLAGLAAYLFAGERWGRAAGLAAGAAYLFAPYLAYDVLFRGNLAETAAFIWPPIVLWGLGRAASERSRAHKGAVIAAVGFAALVLTHNIFALLSAPLFLGYAVLLAWQARSWRLIGLLLGTLALGASLSAYFWAPALLERGLVHSDRLFVAPIFTWYTNFISAGDLLALPRVEDPLLLNPSPPRALGAVTALLALPAVATAALGALRLARVRRARAALDATPFSSATSQVLLFAAALLGYGLLTLPISEPVWRLIGPLALVQFPWRMLGPAALCAAVLVGASVSVASDWMARRHVASGPAALPLVGVIALLFFGNLSWWYPRYCNSPPPGTVAGLIEFEIGSATIGTTAKGEYLPLSAGGVPGDMTLAEALLQGIEPSRLRLPAGAQVTSASTGDPLDARYEIQASQAVTAIYQQFHYPGWRVTVDGAAVPTYPDPSTGLIAFEVPAGAHSVRVAFGLTPLRIAAIGVSSLGLGFLAILGITATATKVTPFPQAFAERRDGGRGDRSVSPHLASLPLAISTIVLCALLPVLRVTLFASHNNPFQSLDFAQSASSLGQNPLALDIAGGLRLFGYDLSSPSLPADGSLDVALNLARTEPSERRLWPIFFIEDEAGLAWHDPDYLPPRWQREPPPTSLWPPDQYAQWARRLSLAPGTPPGTYTLWGQVFDLDSQQIASVVDSAGSAIAPRFELGQLTIERPARPFRLAPPQPVEQAFGPLTLLGYGLDRADLKAGDSLLLSLFWRSDAPAPADWMAQVRLAAVAGNQAPTHEVEIEPANGYPTSQWQPGDQWRGQVRVRLPAALPNGDYDLSLLMPGAGPGQRNLGRVHVSAPARTFEPIPAAEPNGAQFEGVGVLSGYTISTGTGALLVDLVWTAGATPDTTYSVFVHLQDRDGRIWAQSDGEPANWSRPTTGWLAGEWVLDRHSLALPSDLPAGSYTLWVGLYEPRSNLRVPATGPGAAPDQRVSLGEVQWP